LIMGVVNVTPDSFSDGGLYLNPERAIERAVELVRQGADWIDIGGESSRPGSKPVPAEEELKRVLPIIRGLRRKLPALPISIDTMKAVVAEEAARSGASIINDVSGLRSDPRIAEVARRHKALLVLMHMRGQPQTMQQRPFAKSIWRSLYKGVERSVQRALDSGVHRSQLIIDPGLGFGKTRRQNYEILAHLNRLAQFHLPILVGTSRKSFVQAIVAGEGLEPPQKRVVSPWRLTSRKAKNSDPSPLLQVGDATVVALSILGGAHIVRVHDVRETVDFLKVLNAIEPSSAGTRHPAPGTARGARR